jgi:hypothetical protein
MFECEKFDKLTTFLGWLSAYPTQGQCYYKLSVEFAAIVQQKGQEAITEADRKPLRDYLNVYLPAEKVDVLMNGHEQQWEEKQLDAWLRQHEQVGNKIGAYFNGAVNKWLYDRKQGRDSPRP